MSDEQYKECTAKIKALADIRKLALDDTDSIIRAFHANVHGQKQPLIEGLTAEEEKILDIEGRRALASGLGENEKEPAQEIAVLNVPANGANGSHADGAVNPEASVCC